MVTSGYLLRKHIYFLSKGSKKTLVAVFKMGVIETKVGKKVAIN